jgi:ADP-dependent NAD(P)H-hydrate dehydratase
MTRQTIHEVPHLPARAPEGHKGTYGKVLVIAGSRDMSGAAILCGHAALRGGAGLVQLAIPAGIQDRVALANPCYLTTPLAQDSAGRLSAEALAELLPLVETARVAVVGPGLGQSADIARVIRALLEQTTLPLILDADALNVLNTGEAPVRGTLAQPGRVIITPHPGEFARLVGTSVGEVQRQRVEQAAALAERWNVVVALKGHATVVTDGQRVYVNTTGNPGMATGGTGDVLTGLLGALRCQGLESFAAAQLGVYLHGLAGDLARQQVGEVSLIATDLIDYLPGAFLVHARGDGSHG